MTFHEYGKQNDRNIVLIHPSVVTWDYFSRVCPRLCEDFHLIIPALPGYDREAPDEDFTSVEDISARISDYLVLKGIEDVDILYGCSMGGSVALRMLADHKVHVKNAIADGAITPYQLPWLITRLIAVRDFMMVSVVKAGGLKILEKAFSTDEYSKEDLEYLSGVLHFMSYKTIWRTFESCNNYKMPDPVPEISGHLEYWYGDKEEKDRAWDIQYVKRHFPGTKLVKIRNCGHGSMVPLYPQELAVRFKMLIHR